MYDVIILWAAIAETAKFYLPKQPLCSFTNILSLQFYLLYGMCCISNCIHFQCELQLF